MRRVIGYRLAALTVLIIAFPYLVLGVNSLIAATSGACAVLVNAVYYGGRWLRRRFAKPSEGDASSNIAAASRPPDAGRLRGAEPARPAT